MLFCVAYERTSLEYVIWALSSNYMVGYVGILSKPYDHKRLCGCGQRVFLFGTSSRLRDYSETLTKPHLCTNARLYFTITFLEQRPYPTILYCGHTADFHFEENNANVEIQIF